jgi:signal peptidase I
MKKNGLIKDIKPDTDLPGGDDVFPYDTVGVHKNWTRDNFGPVWIPRKGPV